MCAKWWSTAAIAAALTASTIWFKEGGGSAPEAFTMLELGVRGGRRCVTQGLNIRGENGGVSLSLCSAAWNIKGGTCRLSRPVRRGCRPESLSEVPEKVPRLAFPRPLEGSSRRRCPVVEEEHCLKNQSGRYVVLQRFRGGSHGAIAHRRGCHRPLPGGHGGVGWRSRLGRWGGCGPPSRGPERG